MDRGASPHLSWMLVPVSGVLVLSALSLPRQPFTGLILRGDRVVTVMPASPGERAQLRAGDRVLIWPARANAPQNPLADAAPHRPLKLLRERADRLDEIVLVPEPLPASERRMMAGLLAVASGFVLLGGWVWSQRRDSLTRAFFLLCLAFAWLIAPFPRFSSRSIALAYETLYSGVTVFLPALFVHFFALFPERLAVRGRRRSLAAIAYGVAAVLFAAEVAITAISMFTGNGLESTLELLQSVAALWFAAGVAAALGLFVRSYRRARNDDARRRLRVALIGTALGMTPLVALVLLHNLAPGPPLPGEGWAVMLTLLVPASFAWAALVHRVFEFRVALRAAAALAALALIGGLVFWAGEWLAQAWRADLGSGIAGGALAFVALAAAVAGPAGAWLRALGERVIPDEHDRSLSEWMIRHPSARGSAREQLEAACATVAERLLLDGCAALELEGDSVRHAARVGHTRLPEIAALGTDLLRTLGRTPVGLDDPRLAGGACRALEAAGVCWVLPVGNDAARVALLLGRRLSGPWLSIPEIRDLTRFAHHLDVVLDNARLREEATVHGAYGRELTRAQEIQAHLLPRKAPNYPSLDCAAAALSSEPVGGDYYDFVKAPGRVLTLAVGDAAGHGVPAALMGVWAQACFRNEARRGAGPGQVLTALNRELVSMEQPEAFVALLCARIEVLSGRFHYANAGLTPPLLRRADGTCEELMQSGVLLGVTPDAAYPDASVDLESGDVIVLYTDGLTEARHGDEMYGVERMAAALHRCAERRAAEIVRELMSEVQAFADHPLDDLTVVVLKQILAPVRAPGALQNPLKWRTTPADAVG